MAAKEADQEFVEYVVEQLVTKPEAVVTKRTIDELGVLIELTVDRDDMGVVIGKEGKTAKAIRTLLRVLGAKNDSRINLKIVEPEGGEPRPPREEKHEEVKPSIADSEPAEPTDVQSLPSARLRDDAEAPEVEDEEKVTEAEPTEEPEEKNEDEAPMADLDI